jgi:hypothetical protein
MIELSYRIFEYDGIEYEAMVATRHDEAYKCAVRLQGSNQYVFVILENERVAQVRAISYEEHMTTNDAVVARVVSDNPFDTGNPPCAGIGRIRHKDGRVLAAEYVVSTEGSFWKYEGFDGRIPSDEIVGWRPSGQYTNEAFVQKIITPPRLITFRTTTIQETLENGVVLKRNDDVSEREEWCVRVLLRANFRQEKRTYTFKTRAEADQLVEGSIVRQSDGYLYLIDE